ncbi:MAG TPA: hypothetical protein VK588_12495 [Chitinophagaceae bacterium]|nr:hypothetical protein [Chitinophagaceae bacterium]
MSFFFFSKNFNKEYFTIYLAFMEDTDQNSGFPWVLAFLTNSFCCLGFVGFMKLLNMGIPPLFEWIGFTSLLLGSLLGVFSIVNKRKEFSNPDNL